VFVLWQLNPGCTKPPGYQCDRVGKNNLSVPAEVRLSLLSLSLIQKYKLNVRNVCSLKKIHSFCKIEYELTVRYFVRSSVPQKTPQIPAGFFSEW
jgi:hypothetical protein